MLEVVPRVNENSVSSILIFKSGYQSTCSFWGMIDLNKHLARFQLYRAVHYRFQTALALKPGPWSTCTSHELPIIRPLRASPPRM